MNGLHDQLDDALLWRVNQQEFSVRLRSAACVAYIRNRHDPVAAAVVAALLEQPQGTDHAPCQVCIS
jgi:RNA polymerase III subunit RPC82